MQFQLAKQEHTEQIAELVRQTIEEVYPKYYPVEVVDFFLQLHNQQNVEKDICSNKTYRLVDNGTLVGTGRYDENHITRVYVSPEHQKHGYGSYIMNQLEQIIKLNYNNVVLDSSLPANNLYKKLGYITIENCQCIVENSVVLKYEMMHKIL